VSERPAECPLLVVLTYRAVFAAEVFYKPTPYRPVFSRIFLRACKTAILPAISTCCILDVSQCKLHVWSHYFVGRFTQEVAMSKAVTAGATALLGCILCATPVTPRLSPEGKVSLSMESASAVDGVNRRAHRRAYRRDYLSPSGHGYDAYCGFRNRCDYSAYERFSYHGFWGNYGFAHTPWWSCVGCAVSAGH